MTLTRPAIGATPVHQLTRSVNFDRSPTCVVGGPDDCAVGWDEIAAATAAPGSRVVVVDCYPGVRPADVAELVRRLTPSLTVDVASAMRPSAELDAMLADEVTDDPVFGRLSQRRLVEFFVPARLAELREQVRRAAGRVVVHGVGAALVADDAVVVYADLPRREATLRHNSGETANLGADNAAERPGLKYKRSYFVDWRVADRHKRDLDDRTDFLLDTTSPVPRLVTAAGYRRALAAVARRPFRVVPWFEPAPWGGQWMTTVCGLDPTAVNHGWCFDCVPEENSLLLDFGRGPVEFPSCNLVDRHPVEILGAEVAARFGGEFPIRFDFLDTMGGGNLSLQVHPLTSYIRDNFRLTFTQDESYYMLDAAADATVYLGVRDGIEPAAMVQALRAAQDGGPPFPAEEFVNRWPAQRHDHFLIPAGTVHCSGGGGMVLEISATPYIFTFKLWDWDRLGLDGRPRPVHLEHGMRNIQWQRGSAYTENHLINQVTPVASGDGWCSERTGLHEAEFIDTHRTWFTGTAPHNTAGTVNVLNLVQGEEALVESPAGAFEPFAVHYAETFIVPAAVGAYTIRPFGRGAGTECATIKAFVRPHSS